MAKRKRNENVYGRPVASGTRPKQSRLLPSEAEAPYRCRIRYFIHFDAPAGRFVGIPEAILQHQDIRRVMAVWYINNRYKCRAARRSGAGGSCQSAIYLRDFSEKKRTLGDDARSWRNISSVGDAWIMTPDRWRQIEDLYRAAKIAVPPNVRRCWALPIRKSDFAWSACSKVESGSQILDQPAGGFAVGSHKNGDRQRGPARARIRSKRKSARAAWERFTALYRHATRARGGYEDWGRTLQRTIQLENA